MPCCTRDAPSARDRTTASKGSCNNTEGEKRSETYLEDEGAAAPVKRNRKRCRCRELREREREKFKRDNSVSVSYTTKGKNPPKEECGCGGQSSFQAYLLNKIRLDPVPSSEGGRDYSEIPSIPGQSSSELSSPPPRRGKRERWRMGNPRSWSPHFFIFLFSALSLVNLTRTISSSFPRPGCSLSEAIVARPRRGREGYMFYRRNSS